jgi:hypothetical protein
MVTERTSVRKSPAASTQTISITVPREPARAGIDPSNKLIDRNREDNVVDVKTQNGDAP